MSTPQPKQSSSYQDELAQKSIINQLPESPNNLPQKAQLYESKDFLLTSRMHNAMFGNNNPSARSVGMFKAEQARIAELDKQVKMLRRDNNQQKKIIETISQELRFKKSNNMIENHKLVVQERDRLIVENRQLREELVYKSDQIKELQVQLEQSRQRAQRSQQQLIKKRISVSGQNSVQTNRRDLQQKLTIAQLKNEINEYLGQIDRLNQQVNLLKKQNVIDHHYMRSEQFLRAPERSISPSKMSRFTQLQQSRAQRDLLDNQRYNLKLQQKSREYDQLYMKFQALEAEYNNVEDINKDLQRERQFLAQRLSSLEIHQDGDEVAGELQNKLVLMSTQLMRMGHLSRTKTKQCTQLTVKIKQLLIRKQQLQKDLLQKDRVILNYKQELRLSEMRSERARESRMVIVGDHQSIRSNRPSRQIQNITKMYHEKIEALKDSQIQKAILEQKYFRLQKEHKQLMLQQKEMNTSYKQYKTATTTIKNLQADINYLKDKNNSLKEEMGQMQSKLQTNRNQLSYAHAQQQETHKNNLQLQSTIAKLQEKERNIQIQVQQNQIGLKQALHRAQQQIITINSQLQKTQEKLEIAEKQVQRGGKTRADQSRLQELLAQIQSLQAIQFNLKLLLNEYQEKIAMLAHQNQRITLINQNKQGQQLKRMNSQKQQQQLDKKVRELNSQIQKLNGRQKRYKEENQSLRQKLRSSILQEREQDQWEFKYRQLKDQVQVFSGQNINKDQEISRLQNRNQVLSDQKYTLQKKNQQLMVRLDSFKGQRGQSSSDFQAYKQQIKKLQSLLSSERTKVGQLQQKGQESDELFMTFSGQIERLNKVLGQIMQDNVRLKKQLDLVQHKLTVCEQSLQNRKNTNMSSEKSIAQAQVKYKFQESLQKIKMLQISIQSFKRQADFSKTNSRDLQAKSRKLQNEKQYMQQRIQDLQSQLNSRTQSFKTAEDSFRIIIMQIKRSNQRLQQSLAQIQNHYIQKLEGKEQECVKLQAQRKSLQQKVYQGQKKMSVMQFQLASQIKEKNIYISNLSSNHSNAKGEVQQIRKAKGQYQIQIALLTQQINKANRQNQQFEKENSSLKQQLKRNQNKFTDSMRQSTVYNHNIDILSTQIQRLNSVIMANGQKIKEVQKKSARIEGQKNIIQREKADEKAKRQQLQRNFFSEQQNLAQRLIKAEQSNTHLKQQIQDKTKLHEQLQMRLKAKEEKDEASSNEYMQGLAQEIKLLRQGNQNLQKRLNHVTKEYQQVVKQLEQQRKVKSSQQEETMRMMGTFEANINHVTQQKNSISRQKNDLKADFNKMQLQLQQVRQGYKISQQKVRIYQQKCRRLEDRNKVIQERLRGNQQLSRNYTILEQKNRAYEQQSQEQTTHYIKTVADQMKLLRQGNQGLQTKLSTITKEYQQLVAQLQHYKRPKSNSQQSDQKMRIIGNYQATIQHIKQQLANALNDKNKVKIQYDNIVKISQQFKQRIRIAQELNKFMQQKYQALEERNRQTQQRFKQTERKMQIGQEKTQGSRADRQAIEQKMFSVLQEVSRLQFIIKSKDSQVSQLQAEVQRLSIFEQKMYNSGTIQNKKGIFVIKQASQVDQRSRSASGNGLVVSSQVVTVSNSAYDQLKQRYQLLESVHKKLACDSECYRKKSVQYEFKMKKLKEQFDVINRLIHQYREENQKLKENNRLLNAQLQQRNQMISSRSQQAFNLHQTSTSPQHSNVRTNSILQKSNYYSSSQRVSSPTNIRN